MFTEEELAAFMALLRNFVARTRMSGNACAILFEVSAPTMIRWVRNATTPGAQQMTVYRYIAQPVSDTITKLDALDEASGGALYRSVRDAERRHRTGMLREAIQKTTQQ